MTSINFEIIKKKCEELINLIQNKERELINVLSVYQPYHVSCYEIERCIRTLRNIDDNRRYFEKTVNFISVFLPSNLPLYSFLLFAVIPSFQCRQLFIYPNHMLQGQKLIEKIYDTLGMNRSFPDINITSKNHDIFVEECVTKSEVVIFTGRNDTRKKITKRMIDNSILIYNGAGHNPVVVGEDADISKAVEDCVYVKFFNSGQDCAGPDAILVHKNISDAFVKKFKEKCASLIVGTLDDKETFVGPLYRETELNRLKELIKSYRKYVIYGGDANDEYNLLYPTIIFAKLTETRNYKEVFGPIAFILEYETDDELRLYFQDKAGLYQNNKMYVSLYGSSKYVTERDDILHLKTNKNAKRSIGIILKNETVHDAEIGTKPYGGFSKGASAVIVKNSDGTFSSTACPILIPEVIQKIAVLKKPPSDLQANYMVSNESVNDTQHSFTLQIEYDFKQKINEIFGNNLEFAFIFGSVAKGTYTLNKSDIDTFVCLKKQDKVKIEIFRNWIVNYQLSVNLKPDYDFPSEIVCYNYLKNVISDLENVTIKLCCDSRDDFNKIFWACILPSFHKKHAFVGGEIGGKNLSLLIRRCAGYPKKWANDLISIIQNCDELPVNVEIYFPNCDKIKVVKELRMLYDKHEYCEIMRLIDFSKAT